MLKVSILQLLFVIFIICTMTVPSSCYRFCQEQTDCYVGNIQCGFCVDKMYPKVKNSVCVYPFDYMFYSGSECSVNLDCYCLGNGKCQQFSAGEIPSCYCNEGYYGDACQYFIPAGEENSVSRNINWNFTGIVNPYQYVSEILYVACDGTGGSDVFIEAETADGYFVSFVSDRGRECHINKDATLVFSTLTVRFSYKFIDEPYRQFFMRGNIVLGYLSTYWVSYTQKEVLPQYISKRRFEVFVSYQNADLKCVPVVEILDCASYRTVMVDFTRSDPIRLQSSVFFVADGRYVSSSVVEPKCSENVIYKWRIWKNIKNELGKLVFEVYAQKSLIIKPFSLEKGAYRVLLEVEKVQLKPSKNFAYCYFRVKLQGLIAIIEGGSERTIIRKCGLVLDGRKSYDPNVPRDKQFHLMATWACFKVSDPKNNICSVTTSVKDIKYVPSESLEYGAVYNVILTVLTKDSNVPSSQARAKITVAEKDVDMDLFIVCLSNCKEKVLNDQILYLKAGSSNKHIVGNYTWTYYEEGQKVEVDAKNISVGDLPNHMLMVKENALEEGKHYTIVVRVLKLAAKFAFETKQVNFDGNCSVFPLTGIRGFSYFDIVCENFSSQFRYEFFDKFPEENDEHVKFNGRMLGTSFTGRLEKVKITRGLIVAYIIDSSGLYASKEISVNLTEWKVDQEAVDKMFQNLSEIAKTGQNQEILSYISSISEMVLNDTDKSVILDRLIFYISRISMNSLADIELLTSTLTNVLQTLNKPTQLRLDSKLIKNVLKVNQKGTKLLSTLVGRGESLQGTSPDEIKRVATSQVNCVKAILSCRDPQTGNFNEFRNNLKDFNNLMESSKLVMETMDLTQNTLTFLQAPGQPPTKIASDNGTYVMLVAKNDKDYNLTNYFNKKVNSSVLISNSLMKILEKDVYSSEETLSTSLQLTNIHDNIFWWCKSDVKSNFVSVSIAREKKNCCKLKKVEYLDQSIILSVDLNPNIKGIKITDRGFRKDNQFDKEAAIKIHRLDPTPRSLLTLKFLFPETTGRLLVVVLINRRPDSRDIEKLGQNITNNTQYYKFDGGFYQEKQSFLYVGILPAEDNTNVSYTFEVNTTLCQYWTGGQWSSSGCKINNKNDLEVTCKCSHLSVFAAAFPVPPQEIDPFADAKLFLTVFENPVVVSFVAAVLFVYLLLCFWARWKDKIDKKMRNVIVLDDNYPNDTYPYLIAVYTSSRFNSGTSAHVGIRINGELADSRAHILSSKDRKVLQKNYDDWFLIFCPEYLGTLKCLHIWHDNAGSSPDWFSARIVVYDLTNSIQAVFVIDQWLAILLDEYPEAKVMPATVIEVKSVKRIFLSNFILGIRQFHSLFSIILRHPRSDISRLQRISVYMCLFMTAMLCSIMFYDPSSPAEDSRYRVGTRDLLISLESLLITLVLTFFVLFAFKRSYSYTKVSQERFSLLQRKSLFEDQQQPVIDKPRENSIYNKFVKYVTKTLKSSPLAPAQLPNSQRVVVVRKKWLVFAWILCVTVIIICSYFVMLYGLKLGKVKSKQWLTSVLMTLVEDTLLVGPLKIILYAIVLSAVFQKICEEDRHTVNYNDVMVLERPFDKRYLEKLIIKRSDPMYAPLQFNTRLDMIKKKEVKSHWWTVIDFFVALSFVFVLSAVVFKLWSSHYYTNSSIVNLMTNPDFVLGPDCFCGIKYIEDLNAYLQSSYLRKLYKTFWYNNMPINYDDIPEHNIYWSEQFTQVFLGLQKLRQYRVFTINCDFKYIKTDKMCIPHFSEAYEDKEAYNPGWQPYEYSFDEKNSPWIYSRDEESLSFWLTAYRLCGASDRLYDSDGYTTLLGPKIENVVKTVSELVNNNWQDPLTKAVILELSLYNVNLDLLSQVTIIVEYILAGTIKLKAEATTIEMEMKMELWNGLCIVFIAYYFITSAYTINRLGFVEYTKSVRNLTQLLVVILGIFCIALAIVHYYNSTSYYKTFVGSGPENYFNFDIFIVYFNFLQMLLSILLAVAMFRTIGIFRAGRRILNHVYTLILSLKLVIWMLLIVSCFSLTHVPLFVLLNIFCMSGYKEILLDPKSYRFLETRDFELHHIRVIVFVKTVLYGIFMGLFITIFLYFAKIAKTYRERSTDKFNMVLFVINGIRGKKSKDSSDMTIF